MCLRPRVQMVARPRKSTRACVCVCETERERERRRVGWRGKKREEEEGGLAVSHLCRQHSRQLELVDTAVPVGIVLYKQTEGIFPAEMQISTAVAHAED